LSEEKQKVKAGLLMIERTGNNFSPTKKIGKRGLQAVPPPHRLHFHSPWGRRKRLSTTS